MKLRILNWILIIGQLLVFEHTHVIDTYCLRNWSEAGCKLDWKKPPGMWAVEFNDSLFWFRSKLLHACFRSLICRVKHPQHLSKFLTCLLSHWLTGQIPQGLNACDQSGTGPVERVAVMIFATRTGILTKDSCNFNRYCITWENLKTMLKS